MGKVIKVLDRNLLRTVGMKTVLDPERADADQIGRFGEVILMDWGLAKRKGGHEPALASPGQTTEPQRRPGTSSSSSRHSSARRRGRTGPEFA